MYKKFKLALLVGLAARAEAKRAEAERAEAKRAARAKAWAARAVWAEVETEADKKFLVRRQLVAAILEAALLIGTIVWAKPRLETWLFPPQPDDSLRNYAARIERSTQPPLVDVIYIEISESKGGSRRLVIYQSILRTDFKRAETDKVYATTSSVVKNIRASDPKITTVVIFILEGKDKVYAVTSMWVYDAKILAEVGTNQAFQTSKNLSGTLMPVEKIRWPGIDREKGSG